MPTISRVHPKIELSVCGRVPPLTCFALALAFCLPLPGCSGCTSQAAAPPSESREPSAQLPPNQAFPDQPTEPATASAAADGPAELIPPAAQTSAVTSAGAEIPPESDGTPGSEEPTRSGPGHSAPTTTAQSVDAPADLAPGEVAAALREAVRLQSQARAAAQRGNIGRAFQLASQSWEQIQPFQNQPSCQSLVRDLTADLQRYGQAANGKYGGKAREGDRPLIEQ